MAAAGATQYGRPVWAVDIGVKHLPREVFEVPRYTAKTNRLMSHNCNYFSNEVAQFLVGAGILEYIPKLPNEVMCNPMGPQIMPIVPSETVLAYTDTSLCTHGAEGDTPQLTPQDAG